MTASLAGKTILFGVTGSIAAFKAAGWVSALRKEEARVTVVMTEAGTCFVSPLTFAALSGNRVYTHLFDSQTPEEIPHISLSRDKDLVIVAPATARTIAKLANGLADDLLSSAILAASSPVLICPAMNSRMYKHPATQANIVKLKEFGYRVIGPDSGSMACGDEGPGRLPEWEDAREYILAVLSPQDLQGQTILITAGPTREALDPARFLGNRSSGRMGYALAKAAKRRGARVVLVSGPTALKPPVGVETIQVESADEMYEAVLSRYKEATIVVKAAAVADFKPAAVSAGKIKKNEMAPMLGLTRNRDILEELGKRKNGADGPILIGFAAESQEHLSEGRRKLKEKNLDMIVINDILADNTGFDSPTNRVTILDRSGNALELPLLSKEETADRIWDRVVSGE